MRKSLFALALFSWLLSACGYYSFKGALPSYLNSVAVPLFDDRSAWPDIREKVTDSVINGFVDDNTLKVVDESKAAVLLTGTILSVNRVEQAVEQGENVTEYRLIVRVKVKCEDVRASKKMYDKTFEAYTLLQSNAGQDEIDAAVDEALKIITEDIVNTTLSGW